MNVKITSIICMVLLLLPMIVLSDNYIVTVPITVTANRVSGTNLTQLTVLCDGVSNNFVVGVNPIEVFSYNCSFTQNITPNVFNTTYLINNTIVITNTTIYNYSILYNYSMINYSILNITCPSIPSIPECPVCPSYNVTPSCDCQYAFDYDTVVNRVTDNLKQSLNDNIRQQVDTAIITNNTSAVIPTEESTQDGIAEWMAKHIFVLVIASVVIIILIVIAVGIIILKFKSQPIKTKQFEPVSRVMQKQEDNTKATKPMDFIESMPVERKQQVKSKAKSIENINEMDEMFESK